MTALPAYAAEGDKFHRGVAPPHTLTRVALFTSDSANAESLLPRALRCGNITKPALSAAFIFSPSAARLIS